MAIAFACQRCSTRFKVPDDLAGRKARCKKCGCQLIVPATAATVAAVAASGLFRMGVAQARQPLIPPLQPPDGPAKALEASTESYRLVPVASQDDLQAIKKQAKIKADLWAEEKAVEYELAPSFEASLPRPPLYSKPLPPKRFIWGRGGVGESLLLFVRKISDFAYSISMLALLVLLLAVVIKSRTLAIEVAVVVVLVNIARLCMDGFVLVTLAFKAGPIAGVLFFIPPFTFYYLYKRGQVMQDALRRFLGPAIPILAVVLLFVFVPFLREDKPLKETNMGERLHDKVEQIEDKLNRLPAEVPK